MKRKLILLAFTAMCIMQLAVCAHLIRRWEVVLRRGDPFTFAVQPFDPYDAFRGRYIAIRFEQDHIPLDEALPPGTYKGGDEVFATIETDAKGYARFTGLGRKEPADGAPYLKCAVQYVDDSATVRDSDILDPLALAGMIMKGEDAISKRIRETMQEYERKQIEQSVQSNSAMPNLSMTLSGTLNRMLYDEMLGATLHVRIQDGGYYVNMRHMRKAMQEVYGEVLMPPAATRVYLDLPFDRFYMEETKAPQAETLFWQHSRTSSEERTVVKVRILNGVGVIENVLIGDKPIAEF